MLLPNNKQETKFFQFAGAARFAYNWALAKEMQAFKTGQGFISAKDLRKEFTTVRHATETNWLEDISNNVTKQSIKDGVAAYKKFFQRQKDTGIKYTKKKLAHLARIGKKPTIYDMYGHPKFRSKKSGNYRFYQDTAKIRFTSTHVKLENLTRSKRKNKQRFNWIRLAEHGRIPITGKYMNPRISYDGEHWWIAVTIEEDLPKSVGIYADSLGIDLGIKKLAVCSDDQTYENINKTSKIHRLTKQKHRLQQQLSRAYRLINCSPTNSRHWQKSKNLLKSEKKLLHLNHRLSNLRQNYTHQITSEIFKRKPSLICLEDLNILGMMKNKYLVERVQETKLFEFRRQIEYKAQKQAFR